jgi:protein YIPF6
VLSIATNADDKTLLFEIVFCIVWVGGAVIAVNG